MLLRLATEDDVRAMARLAAAAFIDDPIDTCLYPGRRDYPKFVDTQERLLRQSFDRPCGSAAVVTLEAGDEGWQDGLDIVGFCVSTREFHRRRKKGSEKSMLPACPRTEAASDARGRGERAFHGCEDARRQQG